VSLAGPAVDAGWRPAPLPSLDGITEIELDCETNGLRWFDGHRPIGMAIYYGDKKQKRKKCSLSEVFL
jgi:hypothetical protein